jgi:hypothetical protein
MPIGTSKVGGYSTSANPLTYSVVCFAATGGGPTTFQNVNWGTKDANTLYLFEQGLVLTGSNSIAGTIDMNGGMFCQGTQKGTGASATCNWNSQPGFAITAPANVKDSNGNTVTAYAFNGMAFVMPGQNTSSACESSYNGTAAPAYNNAYPNIPDACLQMQFGSSTGQLDGMVYAPYAALYLQDNGGGIGATNLIVGDVVDKSSSLTINANYNYGHDSPLNHVALVE